MRKPAFYAYAKTKAQISCVVTAKLISVQSLHFLTLKFQASNLLCGGTARFVPDSIRNPGDRFARDAAHIIGNPVLNLNPLCMYHVCMLKKLA